MKQSPVCVTVMVKYCSMTHCGLECETIDLQSCDFTEAKLPVSSIDPTNDRWGEYQLYSFIWCCPFRRLIRVTHGKRLESVQHYCNDHRDEVGVKPFAHFACLAECILSDPCRDATPIAADAYFKSATCSQGQQCPPCVWPHSKWCFAMRRRPLSAHTAALLGEGGA